MTERTRSSVSASLRSAINEGLDVIDRVSKTSKRLSLEGTAGLVGSFGGLLGVAAAYALAIAVPSVTFVIAGPIALGLGITGGLLAFRGTAAAKIDRELDNRRRAASYIMEQIRLLPRSAPKEIRDGLYLQYHKVVTNSEAPQISPKIAPAQIERPYSSDL